MSIKPQCFYFRHENFGQQKTIYLPKSIKSNWLVVSTHLKIIGQIASSPQVGLKINIFETTTQFNMFSFDFWGAVALEGSLFNKNPVQRLDTWHD